MVGTITCKTYLFAVVVSESANCLNLFTNPSALSTPLSELSCCKTAILAFLLAENLAILPFNSSNILSATTPPAALLSVAAVAKTAP